MTYNLHSTQQRTSMEEKGEGRKRERKRDEGREGVSEPDPKLKKGKFKGERGTIFYSMRERERERERKKE